MASEQRPPRESIWSVPRNAQRLYHGLFSVQVFVCVGLFLWHEIAQNTKDGGWETFVAIGHGLAPFVLVIAAETLVIVEFVVVLADWLRERREKRVEQARAEVDRWREWNRRRIEAGFRGEMFNEPPPSDEDEK